jgi:uncharacterized protein YxjI
MYVIREKLFRLGEDSDIFDESGPLVLHVDGKVMSLHDRLVLRDPGGTRGGAGVAQTCLAAADVSGLDRR